MLNDKNEWMSEVVFDGDAVRFMLGVIPYGSYCQDEVIYNMKPIKPNIGWIGQVATWSLQDEIIVARYLRSYRTLYPLHRIDEVQHNRVLQMIWDDIEKGQAALKAIGVTVETGIERDVKPLDDGILSKIKTARRIADAKGGSVLGTYIDKKTQKQMVVIKCCMGHEFRIALDKISYGNRMDQWCPICRRFVWSEEVIRVIFQRIFKREFPKYRPKFLKNMELDGYNQELNLGFEVNGSSHRSNFLGRNRLENDRKKAELCRENGLKLVVIKIDKVSPTEYYEVVMREISMMGDDMVRSSMVGVEERFNVTKLDLPSPQRETMRLRAESLGWTMLDKVYLGPDYHHRFRCRFGSYFKMKEWYMPQKPSGFLQCLCPVCKSGKGGGRRRVGKEIRAEATREWFQHIWRRE